MSFFLKIKERVSKRQNWKQFPRIAPLITLELTERLLRVKATTEIRHMPGNQKEKYKTWQKKGRKIKRIETDWLIRCGSATKTASWHSDKVLMCARVMWQIYRPLPLFVAVAISPVNTPRHTTRSVHTQPPKAKLNGQKGNIWAAKENTAEGKTAKVQKKYLKYFFSTA